MSTKEQVYIIIILKLFNCIMCNFYIFKHIFNVLLMHTRMHDDKNTIKKVY
jgi:hypothetical protein